MEAVAEEVGTGRGLGTVLTEATSCGGNGIGGSGSMSLYLAGN